MLWHFCSRRQNISSLCFVILICVLYDLPWTLKKYIPFYGGAKFHDYHHYVGGQSQSNFSPIFTYCDYIYGTDKGYKYHNRLQQQQQVNLFIC
ncbi:putative 4-alpha-methylsterol monooxygenase [Helianthus anomalus]